MTYDNMYRVTGKSQHLSQTGVQFDGTLSAGYDLTYTYSGDEGRHFQLAGVDDINYSAEAVTEDTKVVKIPNVGKYKDSDNARVIDEYNLINNNCATTSVQSILYGGGDVSSIIGDNIPFLVAKNLHNEVANEQNPISHFLEIIFGDYKPHIRLVSSDEILKETKDE